MKLSDGIIERPDVGICILNVQKVARCFGKSIISRWHDEYRLVNLRAKVKITISKEQAQELIKILNLTEIHSELFNNASTFCNLLS